MGDLLDWDILIRLKIEKNKKQKTNKTKNKQKKKKNRRDILTLIIYGKLKDFLEKNHKSSLPENYKFAKRTGLVRVDQAISQPPSLPPTLSALPDASPSLVPSPSVVAEPTKPVTPLKPVKLTYFQARQLALQPTTSGSPSSLSPSKENGIPKPPPSATVDMTSPTKRTYTSRYYKDKAVKSPTTTDITPKNQPQTNASPSASPTPPSRAPPSPSKPAQPEGILPKIEKRRKIYHAPSFFNHTFFQVPKEEPEQKKDFTGAIATKKFIEAVVKGL
jgi:hypothetical protein